MPTANRKTRSLNRHDLKGRFANATDSEVIETLNSFGSIRRYSRGELANLDGPDGKYHGAVIFYLKKHRPSILQILYRDAHDLAAAWPNNLGSLQDHFAMSGWWSYTLKKTFRQSLADRLRDATPAEWADAIWPLRDALLPEDAASTPSALADALAQKAFIPTIIRNRLGEPIHGKVLQEIRKRFKQDLALLSQE